MPTVVLQYPSKRELIKELKKGYDFVGISFLMAVMHKMKETVALIRRYAPQSQIVLGGYDRVLKDDVLKPYADHLSARKAWPTFAGCWANRRSRCPTSSRWWSAGSGFLDGRFRDREDFCGTGLSEWV